LLHVDYAFLPVRAARLAVVSDCADGSCRQPVRTVLKETKSVVVKSAAVTTEVVRHTVRRAKLFPRLRGWFRG
jgi:hypothetical protein